MEKESLIRLCAKLWQYSTYMKRDKGSAKLIDWVCLWSRIKENNKYNPQSDRGINKKIEPRCREGSAGAVGAA